MISEVYHFARYTKPKEKARTDYRVYQNTIKLLNIANPADKRILDIGCGEMFPIPLLFHSAGANITGIDITAFDTSNVTSLFHVKKGASLKQKIKTMPNNIMHTLYYQELAQLSDFPLNFKGIDIRQMDAGQMTFPDETFDYISSNAAFEHIYNLEEVCSEMSRVMKRDATARVAIHLFPSLTGGHNIWYAPPNSDTVILKGKPWDHLRKEMVNNEHLNRLRERDFKKVIEKYFIIEKWFCSCTDPEKFLTAQLRTELKNWEPEELLKREVVAVLRKKET